MSTIISLTFDLLTTAYSDWLVQATKLDSDGVSFE